jgi:2-phosphosulfolactate phosphatase
MAYFDQEQFDVRCEWGTCAVQHIAPSKLTIVVDVLSFSTSVDVALSRGATIFPYSCNDDTAEAYARARSAELASSRCRFDGQYSLAPSSLINAPSGLRLVLPSPNGSSIAFAAMTRSSKVAAGCIRNASAVAAWAQRSGKQITVVAAGERWPDGSLRPAIEDLLGAGAIISRLQGRRSPEASVAAAAFDFVCGSLREQILLCSSGRELLERGFAADVEIAAELDVSEIVPVLIGDAFITDTATGVVA